MFTVSAEPVFNSMQLGNSLTAKVIELVVLQRRVQVQRNVEGSLGKHLTIDDRGFVVDVAKLKNRSG